MALSHLAGGFNLSFPLGRLSPKWLTWTGSISKSVMTEWTPEGQAEQTPKSLGLRIIRRLRETFVVNENEVFIGFGASGVYP